MSDTDMSWADMREEQVRQEMREDELRARIEQLEAALRLFVEALDCGRAPPLTYYDAARNLLAPHPRED
jgi:hypothetical protein